jgi:hypothetical protein
MYEIHPDHAKKIAEWLAHRGGVLIWHSAKIGSVQTLTTPALLVDGTPDTKPPHWSMKENPEHVTDIGQVFVVEPKEVKRFHVAVRMGGQGLCIKVTDEGSNRIRKELAKAGDNAWYEFDYCDYNNCIIFNEGKKTPLAQYIQEQ